MNSYQAQQLALSGDPQGVAIPFATYMVYLAISVLLTVWVARTLSKNGRYFLVRVFGDEALADSINHLLVVGFYLINFGYVAMTLKMGIRPADPVQALEELSMKIGNVLIVLGIMHFFNLFVFSRIAQRPALRMSMPPVKPTGVLA